MQVTSSLRYFPYRIDGRKCTETRQIVFQPFFSSSPSSTSCFLSFGETKVISTVHGPSDRHGDLPDAPALKVQCHFTDAIQTSKRMVLTELFSSVINLEKYPCSKVDIVIDVLEDDGSCLATAINATVNALVFSGVEMRQMVSAFTVGCVNNRVLLDLLKPEERSFCLASSLVVMDEEGEVYYCDLANVELVDVERIMRVSRASAKKMVAYFRKQIAEVGKRMTRFV